MPSQTPNNAAGALASDHLVGSGTLVLKTGQGGRFGTPTVENPVRVTVARLPTLVSGRIEWATTKTIYDCTDRSGDTLSGLTAVEGTSDQRFYKHDPVQSLITWGMIEEIQAGAVLPTGDEGAILVVGPDAVPEFTNSITQDKVTGLASDLAAKADDSAVVKLTGDQTVTGSKSFNDPVQHDMAENLSHVIDRVIPEPGSQDVTFNRCMATGDGNPVMSLGWNTTGAGQREDLTKPTFRLGFEYDYAIGGEKWMEGHLFACIDPSTGNEMRPLSVVINKSQNYKIDTLMQGSSWTWQNKGQTVQIAQLTRATDESVYYKITGKDSSDSLGYAFSLISDAVTPQDTITIGRKAGLNNNLTVQGFTSASLSLIRQGVSTRFVNDGNFAFICSAGQLFFNRTDDFIVCSRDTARLAFRAQDNGAAVSVGFYGVTPVTRRSGELTTGLVALGLFSSVTIAQSSVTNLVSDLVAKAPLASPTFTGTVTLPTLHATGPVYADLGTATDGATVTFNMSLHNDWLVVLGGNRTLAVSNVQVGQRFNLILDQGTGGRTVTWFSGISWQGGTVPTLTAAASKRDIFNFWCIGSGVYLGSTVGLNY